MCCDSQRGTPRPPGVTSNMHLGSRNVQRPARATLTSLGYGFSIFRIPTVISIYEGLRLGSPVLRDALSDNTRRKLSAAGVADRSPTPGRAISAAGPRTRTMRSEEHTSELQ